MDLLFRPVFVRAKTPVMGSSSFPEHSFTFSADDNNDCEEVVNRIRTTPRVSSYIGLRLGTPQFPAPETFPNLRNPDNVYHKPSGDQLVEMLKVVMMNQNIMDSVPVEYNSTILHVLEAYQDLRLQLERKEEAIEVLKKSHAKDIKDFEKMATAWQQREGEYKTELKKLEVLLSKTKGGLESVAIARSKSVIHGAEKASDVISRSIGTIKARNMARNSQDADSPKCEPLQKVIRYRRSFQIREDRDLSANAGGFESTRRLLRKSTAPESHSQSIHPQIPERSLRLPDSPGVQTQKVSFQSLMNQPKPLSILQLEDLERQREEFCAAFGSSESGAESSPTSHRSEIPAVRGSQGLGIDLLAKPLPRIPKSSQERSKYTTLHRFLHDKQHIYSDTNKAAEHGERTASYQMGFSFRQGDDEDLLGQREDRDRTTRKTVEEHLELRSSLLRPDKLRIETSASIPEPLQQGKVATGPTAKPNSPATGLSTATINKLSQLTHVQNHDQLSRKDSSSSSADIAVRHNSSRSSASNTQAGRSVVSHNAGTGSNEAVSAAARAFAGKKRSPATSRKTSTTGSASGPHAETQTRNDGEGNKRVLAGRKSSTVSCTSKASGVETGNGNKTDRGVRRKKDVMMPARLCMGFEPRASN